MIEFFGAVILALSFFYIVALLFAGGLLLSIAIHNLIEMWIELRKRTRDEPENP